MYAKLVVGGSQINVIMAMRDIGRLITSATPSLSLVSAFNTASSVIIDNTPAGWSYVGGTNAADQPTIASTATTVAMSATGQFNLCFSAPMQNNSNLLKYAVLTNNTAFSQFSAINTGFQLTGATGATSLGIVTNEGPRNSTNGSLSNFDIVSILVAAGTVLHLVANPQHITIVVENTGMTAVWETTSTDAHTFYNIPAFVQYSHYKSALTGRLPIIVPTTGTISAANQSWNATTFNVTNPNSGANFGTYDVTQGTVYNGFTLVNNSINTRVNTVSVTGLPQYAISPIFFTNTLIGYPTQFVTGPVPAYYVSGAMGNTGDTVSVSGDTYFFFNAGAFGLLMKTT
jgi:hypothetical protein